MQSEDVGFFVVNCLFL